MGTLNLMGRVESSYIILESPGKFKHWKLSLRTLCAGFILAVNINAAILLSSGHYS